MSFTCGIGKGKDKDTFEAVRQAAESCHENLGSQPADLLLLFMSSLYAQETVMRELKTFFPNTPLMGCSSAGEIYAQGPDEKSIALLGLAGVEAVLAKGENMFPDAYAAGVKLGKQLGQAAGDLAITLSDGLAGDGAAVVRGIQEGLGHKITLLGGAAGDDVIFQNADLYLNGESLSQTVVGTRLEGDFRFGIGVHHGWEPVGLPVKASKSEGNCLLEINGMPAIRLYEEYFGQYTQKLRDEPLARLGVYYPLGLSVPESSEYILRAPLSVEDNGSIRFTAEIPAGSSVRLMIGSVESALQAARQAAREALAKMQGCPPKLALLIDAVARRRLLGPKAHEEIQAVREIIGDNVPLVGFYAYGEVAPFAPGNSGKSCFHNETLVILMLG